MRLSRGRLGRLTVLSLLAVLCAAVAPAHADRRPAQPPLVGFSFTPLAARFAHLDPPATLSRLLEGLDPDLVRLPVYWGAVEATPGSFDFSEVDDWIARVRRHNARAGAHQTRVVLVAGARNLGFPELFVPGWITIEQQRNLPTILATPTYRAYLDAVAARYSGEPLLYAWQVENEPLDNVVSGAPAAVRLPAAQLTTEVDRLHAADRHHRVVVTTYSSATLDLDELAISPLAHLYDYVAVPAPIGHPQGALDSGDVLGLDVYVATPSTAASTLATVEATKGLTASKRVRWKRDVLDYWGERARSQGKDMWVCEMQADGRQTEGAFTKQTLLESATAYADGSASVVLLWGVEGWLNEPGWLDAGRTAVAVMRGEDPDAGQDL
ncbi:MAG: hypothetical protein M3010_00080 [Candidatus Dormibacteraeota bacterium]|nr:hypothetical protein [Candidatus Dormibacteraeota bacterium]